MLPDIDYLPIVGDWNGDCRDLSTRRWALHTTPLGLQSAPRSLAHSPGAARCPVSAVYHEKNRTVLSVTMSRGERRRTSSKTAMMRNEARVTPGPVVVLNLDYIETSWSTTSTTLLPQRCSSVRDTSLQPG
ncbi:hypothetical protein LSAT2_011319 [Lamellibrachia satsuma]|nr:hypothetical protein LSAT2_011319 [Lamellibrachia satsuma]